jgi:thiol-disulfide isomerase/thioredoxin
MNLNLVILGALALGLAQTLIADDSADALWQKVEDAMNGIKKPAERPKSREEAIANFKKGLNEFDAAEALFLAKAPTDPRRWKAALFAAQTARSREIVGLPAKAGTDGTYAAILKAPDADPQTKGDASAARVLEGASKFESGGGNMAEWTTNAETHLKDYPDHAANASIRSAIQTQSTLAQIKTKPLDLKFTAVDGHPVDLAQLRGKVVLIDFWATWCGPCVAELPNVLKAYEKLHPQGFEIIGISLDSDKGKLEAFTKENGMTWPQFFDGKGWGNEISSSFGIRSIPAMWLLDKKGMVVSTNVRGHLEEEVGKRLAE